MRITPPPQSKPPPHQTSTTQHSAGPRYRRINTEAEAALTVYTPAVVASGVSSNPRKASPLETLPPIRRLAGVEHRTMYTECSQGGVHGHGTSTPQSNAATHNHNVNTAQH